MLESKLDVYWAAVLEEADAGLEVLVRLFVLGMVAAPPLLFILLINDYNC
jgi:hypothetical protein